MFGIWRTATVAALMLFIVLILAVGLAAQLVVEGGTLSVFSYPVSQEDFAIGDDDPEEAGADSGPATSIAAPSGLTATPTAEPTAAPDPTPSPEPVMEVTPDPTPEPTPEPTPSPEPTTQGTPEPTPSPEPPPEGTPSPTPAG